jgi:anti-sigma B factor antagonist
MNINFTDNAGVLSLEIDGRLDTNTAPELEAFITEHADNARELIINCDGLVYVSSAGLRVLLAAHKKMKGEMKLINVTELVMEVLEMTGFTDILVIE